MVVRDEEIVGVLFALFYAQHSKCGNYNVKILWERVLDEETDGICIVVDQAIADSSPIRV